MTYQIDYFPKDTHQELTEKVIEVGKELGMQYDREYHFRLYKEGNTYGYSGRLVNGNKTIDFDVDYWKGKVGRLVIAGVYPKGKKGDVYTRNGERIAITVSPFKTAKQITKDIQRRFLPAYEMHLGNIVERVKSSDSYHEKRESCLKQIADAFGEKVEGEKPVYLYKVSGEQVYTVEAYGDNTVRFEVTTSPERAIKVIHYLKAEYEKEKADEQKS